MADNLKEFENFLIESVKHKSTAKNYLKDFLKFVELLESDYMVSDLNNLSSSKIKSIGESVLATPKYIEHEKATRGRMRAAINNYLKFVNATDRIKGGYKPNLINIKGSISEIIKKYKNLLRKKGLDDELYKWEIIKKYKGLPNLYAEDFEAEIRKIKFYNLIYPTSAGVMVHLAKDRPKEYKGALEYLFDESILIEKRITEFKTLVETIFNEIKSNESDSSYHDERTVSAILTIRYPEKYVFYKSSYYTKYCEYIGIETKQAGKKFSHYLELIDDLVKNYLENDDELLEMYRSHLTDDCFEDKNLKLLAQDILYRTLDGSASKEESLDEENENIRENGDSKMSREPLNLILYGPPGTGKTYNTINKALEIIDGKVPEPRSEAQKRFNNLKEDGQIEFITFHQSYSYEDFVEGIKPDIECESLKFIKKDGIFKKICEKAKAKRTLSYDFDENKIEFHKMSLGDTLADEDDIYEYCMKEGFISTGYGGDLDYSDVEDDADIRRVYFEKYPNWTSFGATAITRFKNKISKGDIVVISKGNRSIRAIGKVVGDYVYNRESPINFNHFRKVEWLYKDGEISVKKILKDKWLSQQSIYTFYNRDINIDGLKELLTGEEQEKSYVLIIDEINRGNISRIFGELITLIEEDKRDGNMTVKLPYSQSDFTVPSNLFIIGTMNTADRSIALLDIALRRRFSFLRFDPDSSLVSFNKAREIMEKLNEEIMKSKGNDFLIGHSYFMKVSTSEELKTVLKYKIKPLLEEYFVNDSGKLKDVLAIVDQEINNA
jgi:hypothetical protein